MRRVPLKLSTRRTGWYGEGCYRQLGRRFLKRLEHRHNRHTANAALRREGR